MNAVKKLVFLLWIFAAVLVTPPLLRSFGLNPKDLMKDLFSTTPNKDVLKPVKPESIPDELLPSENERGRARELRPEISLPPMPEASQSFEKSTSSENQTAEDLPSVQDHKKFNDMISGLENIAKLAPEDEIEDLPVQAYRPKNSAEKVRWMPPPPGFMTADTFNYLIYREKNPVTENIKTVLDNIHGNLMLDLTPFTIIIKPNKILVMLFGEKTSYMKFTKRPAWSGASSNLRSDTMYIIEGNSFYPLSVHELTHLYFDGYFLPTISPLWLSEGMAVYMQINTTKQKPSWVDRSLRRILNGEHIPFEEMTEVETLNDYDTSKAELWYTQAYSLVAYLLKARSRDEFYKLCNEIKASTPLHQALYRAYGMPFNRISVLENVWLHDLQKAYREGKILKTPVKKTEASNSAVSKPTNSSAAASPAPKPATPSTADKTKKSVSTKPTPQKTKINKLKMVPTNSYKGGFN